MNKESLIKANKNLSNQDWVFYELTLERVLDLYLNQAISFEQFHSIIYHQYIHLLAHAGKYDRRWINTFPKKEATPEINSIMMQMKVLLNHPEFFDR